MEEKKGWNNTANASSFGEATQNVTGENAERIPSVQEIIKRIEKRSGRNPPVLSPGDAKVDRSESPDSVRNPPWRESTESTLSDSAAKKTLANTFSESPFKTKQLAATASSTSRTPPATLPKSWKQKTGQGPSIALATQTKVKSQPEICMDLLEGTCRKGVSCLKYHCPKSYQWQIHDSAGDCWVDLPQQQNDQLEKSYCSPNIENYKLSVSSQSNEVSFVNMTMSEKAGSVRRLSSPSWCEEIHSSATIWAWYWLNENEWIPYGSTDKRGMQASLSSKDIETQFLKSPNGSVDVQTKEHSYRLDFNTFTQKNMNPKYPTERPIRRRPVFGTTDNNQSSQQNPLVLSPGDAKVDCSDNNQSSQQFGIPNNWDQAKLPDIGYELVKVNEESEEYKSVSEALNETMPGFVVTKVQRVQNLELWDRYTREKMWMNKRLSGSQQLTEVHLFHGTKTEHVSSICEQGFDPRLSGTSVGTLYGQGSYFARAARYSCKYSDGNTVFLARVLVGEYTFGKEEYTRPPPKPSSSTVMYDSCVNDVSNPRIVVIFERGQAYPEWLVEYAKKPDKPKWIFVHGCSP